MNSFNHISHMNNFSHGLSLLSSNLMVLISDIEKENEELEKYIKVLKEPPKYEYNEIINKYENEKRETDKFIALLNDTRQTKQSLTKLFGKKIRKTQKAKLKASGKQAVSEIIERDKKRKRP